MKLDHVAATDPHILGWAIVGISGVYVLLYVVAWAFSRAYAAGHEQGLQDAYKMLAPVPVPDWAALQAEVGRQFPKTLAYLAGRPQP